MDLLPWQFEIGATRHDHPYLGIVVALLFFVIQPVADGIRRGEGPRNALGASEAGFYGPFILVDGVNSAGNTTQQEPCDKAEHYSGNNGHARPLFNFNFLESRNIVHRLLMAFCVLREVDVCLRRIKIQLSTFRSWGNLRANLTFRHST